MYRVSCWSCELGNKPLRSDAYSGKCYFQMHPQWSLVILVIIGYARISGLKQASSFFLCHPLKHDSTAKIHPQDTVLKDDWVIHKIRAPWARAGGEDERSLEQADWPAELKQTAQCTARDPARMWEMDSGQGRARWQLTYTGIHTCVNTHVRKWRAVKEDPAGNLSLHAPIHVWTHMLGGGKQPREILLATQTHMLPYMFEHTCVHMSYSTHICIKNKFKKDSKDI